MNKNFMIISDSDPKSFLKIQTDLKGPIVVVDDDSEQTKILAKCFKKSGNKSKLVVFDNGQEFVDFINKTQIEQGPLPKLVLLDINMPGIDGFSVLSQIRERAEYQKIPVIVMLTTSNSEDDIQKSKELGANGFWSKPMAILEYVEFFKNLDKAG